MRHRALLAPLVASVGCVSADDAPFARIDLEAPTSLARDPRAPSWPFEPTAPDPEPSGDGRIALRGVPNTVDFVAGLPADGACTNPLDDGCDADYRAFVALAAEHARPRSEAALDELVRTLDAWPRHAEASPAELAEGILEAWNARFLFDQVDEVPTRVWVVHSGDDRWGGWSEELIVEDPWVGRFAARIHSAEAPLAPAVVAVHGHGTEAVDWPDAYGSMDYVDAGFHVAAIDHRMMFANAAQSSVNRALLLAGFTQQGLHAYETLLLHKVLRALPWVDASAIGYIGHSAGSNKGGLLIRTVDAFDALVSDNPTDVGMLDPDQPLFSEGWVPEIWPWQDLANRFEDAPVPVLEVPYGFPHGTGAPLAFFEEALLGEGA